MFLRNVRGNILIDMGTRLYEYGNRLPEVDSYGTTDLPAGIAGGDRGGNLYMLYYTIQGWQVSRYGKRTCYLPPKSLMLIHPGRDVRTDRHGEDGVEARLLKLRPPRPGQSYLGMTHEEWRGLFIAIDGLSSPLIEMPVKTEHLFERMGDYSEELQREPSMGTLLLLKNMVRELLIILSRAKGDGTQAFEGLMASVLPRPPVGGYSDMVVQALDQMNHQPNKGVTLLRVARGTGVPLSRFKARFKEETGLTPLDYYTRLLIRKAMDQLRDTDRSASLIAADLGFSSSPHFSTLFKKTAGITPGEFRKWRDEL